MISVCTKSAEVAKSKSSKRITAAHMKTAIEADVQFDFLNEIVSKVTDAAEGGGEEKVKKRERAVKSESDEDGAAKERKPKSTRGRKKKTDD